MSPSAVSGRVLDSHGRPVAAATVYFVSGPVALPDIAQLTGADGRFSLVAPAPGRYRIGVNAPGTAVQERDIEVASQGAVPIEVQLGEYVMAEPGVESIVTGTVRVKAGGVSVISGGFEAEVQPADPRQFAALDGRTVRITGRRGSPTNLAPRVRA